MKRAWVCFLLACLCLDLVASGMTRAQLKKTLSVMKKSCMPKHGVNEDKVGGIEGGKFIEDHNVMCYIACIYQGINVFKNNRLNFDMVMKQVDNLYPQEMKAPVRAAINQCTHVQDQYADMCEGTFWAVKCLYEKDPANFVFP